MIVDQKAVIRCLAQIRDPTGGSGWWGFLDEQPEIVEGIEEEELIVQEVTQECFFDGGSQKELGKC